MCLPAGFENFMQDVLWCFSQVKGNIDIGVTEGGFTFAFAPVIKENLFPWTSQWSFCFSCSHADNLRCKQVAQMWFFPVYFKAAIQLALSTKTWAP